MPNLKILNELLTLLPSSGDQQHALAGAILDVKRLDKMQRLRIWVAPCYGSETADFGSDLDPTGYQVRKETVRAGIDAVPDFKAKTEEATHA